MIEVPLPRLLDGSLGVERTIRPIAMSMCLSITPLSYASMQLPRDESLPARGYVELYNSMGFAGVFRVRSPQDAYGEDITTAELEHAVVEVGDYLVLAEYDEMMSATTAMTTIFSHYRGNKWQLGSVAALGSGQVAVQVRYERVLEAMMTIMDQKPDCMMDFDFSTRPWTINIVPRGTVVAAEGRLARNVNSAKVIYDDTELCTRCYYESESTGDAGTSRFPAFVASKNYSKDELVSYSGKVYKLTSGHKKGKTWAETSKTLVSDSPTSSWAYVDADTIGTYGLVERAVSTGVDYTPAEALTAANAYLAKHKEPRVSVTISAEELSSVTGEPFDTFTIGKLCRLALVDYGVTVERVVTGLVWDDVFDSPEDIIVTLEDEEDTAITFLHDLDAKGGTGGGGGGASKKQDEVWKEYRTAIQQTDYYLDLYAQRMNKNEEILQQAGLYIDANGVLIYAQDNNNMWGSKLQVEADRISLVVSGSGTNASIKAAAITAAINGGSSEVWISANKTYIDAQTQFLGTALGTTLNCVTLSSVTTAANTISTNWLTCGGSSYMPYWRSTTIVTGVGTTDPDTGAITSLSTKTLYYLGHY